MHFVNYVDMEDTSCTCEGGFWFQEAVRMGADARVFYDFARLVGIC